ncbi:MAG: putative membrane protein [Paracoccaceae bacterium]|jgi:putative membrane protein
MKRTVAVLALAITGFLALSAPVFAQQGQGPAYGSHMWGSGWHGMFFGPIMMIVFIAVAVVVVVLLVRWLGGPGHGGALHSLPGKTPLDILRERFARGEIDKEEFEERRRTLGE